MNKEISLQMEFQITIRKYCINKCQNVRMMTNSQVKIKLWKND